MVNDGSSLTTPFSRVLVANRGEIAIRVIRACREIGVTAIAIYGEGEENALHVRLADEAYRVSSDSLLPYLDIAAIIKLARRANASAIHPGYGFLAENGAFADACHDAGLILIGPPAAAIRVMGDKIAARQLAIAAGVPVVPGSDGTVASVDAARRWAEQHGYPIALKASGGGGGRGFRVVRNETELAPAFEGATGEAARSFGNPTLYAERYLARPRHIEVQVFADREGTVFAVGERDCSIQRRHQKLLEEAPAPGLSDALRAALGDAAVALTRAVDYRGAGTIEFLVAGDGRFYFLEMNTRIQVEHPITEMVTGIDLVKEQLLVAAGRSLSFGPPDLAPRGHAIECRINAEDAGRDFAPSPGTITVYREPGGFGIRVDGAMEAGATILPTYDSLIAKVIAWGRDRDEAITRMSRALAEFEIGGVPTTIPFHRRLIDHPAFRAADLSTIFLLEYPEVLPPPASSSDDSLAADSTSIREIVAEVNGRRFVVRLPDREVRDTPASPSLPSPRRLGQRRSSRSTSVRSGSNGKALPSPLQGTVVRLVATPGQPVHKGEVLLVVEAMKMENELLAHRDGTLESFSVGPGSAVKIGDTLAVIG
jgi:acetyl-CoA/propionyl-CoA carboxylase biotin carboxyl carrier protein